MTDDIPPETRSGPDDAPGADEAQDAEPRPYPDWDPERFHDRAGQEPGDLIPSLSPRQIVGGFVLLAAAVVVLRRLARPRPGSKG
jgi:hypothetical protein